jgi:hypothetical protein
MEKNIRMLWWGSLMLFVISAIALMPFLGHAATTSKWSKLGGAPMIKGGFKNQDDFVKKLGNPAIQKDYIEAFGQAYPEHDSEELFKAFQLAVECSTLTESSYQPGTIFPDGMFFKPKKGVYHDKRPVEWKGNEALESLEVKFPYEDKDFWITVIKKCGNGIPRKVEEEKPAEKAEAPQPQAVQPPVVQPPPPIVEKEKIVVIEKEVPVYVQRIVRIPVQVPIEVPIPIRLTSSWGVPLPLPPPIIMGGGYDEGYPGYYRRGYYRGERNWGYHGYDRYHNDYNRQRYDHLSSHRTSGCSSKKYCPTGRANSHPAPR